MNNLRDSGIYEKLARDSGSRPPLPDPGDIGLLTMKVSFNLLVLISVEVVIYNVLILFILHKTVPFLLQKV